MPWRPWKGEKAVWWFDMCIKCVGRQWGYCRSLTTQHRCDFPLRVYEIQVHGYALELPCPALVLLSNLILASVFE